MCGHTHLALIIFNQNFARLGLFDDAPDCHPGLVGRGGVQPHVVTLEGREVRCMLHLPLPAQDLPPWGLSLPTKRCQVIGMCSLSLILPASPSPPPPVFPSSLSPTQSFIVLVNMLMGDGRGSFAGLVFAGKCPPRGAKRESLPFE